MPLRRAFLLLPLLLVAAWFAWRWSALPEQLSTSFDFAGNARDSMGRTGFVVLSIAMLAGMAALFGGLATWLPSIPSAWVNLPEKEFWLAPERRVETMARLAVFLDVVGLAMCTMLALIFVAIGEHAIAGTDRFPSSWLAAPILLVVVTIFGVAWLDRPFRERRRAARARAR